MRLVLGLTAIVYGDPPRETSAVSTLETGMGVARIVVEVPVFTVVVIVANTV